MVLTDGPGQRTTCPKAGLQHAMPPGEAWGQTLCLGDGALENLGRGRPQMEGDGLVRGWERRPQCWTLTPKETERNYCFNVQKTWENMAWICYSGEPYLKECTKLASFPDVTFFPP